MFVLPKGDGDVTEEGMTEDNPIVLEGYKAKDFESLLRVLYPASRDFVRGGATITKDQWIGALKLSTTWEMKEIRAFAILQLSVKSPPLTPVELVTLARAHKVPSWLVEGLTGLTLDRVISLGALKVAVGLPFAYQLLGIRLKLRDGAKARPLRIGRGHHTGLALDDLRSNCCWEPSIKDKDVACQSCSKFVATDVVGSVYITSTPELRSSQNHTYTSVPRARSELPELSGHLR